MFWLCIREVGIDEKSAMPFEFWNFNTALVTLSHDDILWSY